MKARILLVGFAILAGSSACWAQEASGHQAAGGQRSLTRAEVLQELEEAREQGLLNAPDAEYPVIKDTGPRKTRAEVLLELERARKEGTYTVEPG